MAVRIDRKWRSRPLKWGNLLQFYNQSLVLSRAAEALATPRLLIESSLLGINRK